MDEVRPSVAITRAVDEAASAYVPGLEYVELRLKLEIGTRVSFYIAPDLAREIAQGLIAAADEHGLPR